MYDFIPNSKINSKGTNNLNAKKRNLRRVPWSPSGAFTAKAQVQSPVWKLRDHKPCRWDQRQEKKREENLTKKSESSL